MSSFLWNIAIQATEELSGIAKIATQSEVHTGTDDSKIVTPLKLEQEKGIPNGLASLNASGQIPSDQLSGGGKSMIVTFAAGSDMSIETNTIGYVVKAKFPYAGTDTVGAILEIKANIWKNSSGGSTGQIKIVDISNGGATIAELNGITNTDNTVLLDLGTVTNLPTDASVFELQMGRSSGANRTIECSSLEIVY